MAEVLSLYLFINTLTTNNLFYFMNYIVFLWPKYLCVVIHVPNLEQVERRFFFFCYVLKIKYKFLPQK